MNCRLVLLILSLVISAVSPLHALQLPPNQGPPPSFPQSAFPNGNNPSPRTEPYFGATLQAPGGNTAANNTANRPTQDRSTEIQFFEPGKLVARVGDQTILYGEILGDLNQVVEQEMASASPTIKDLRRKELFAQMLPRLVEQKMIYADFLRNVPDPSQVPVIMDQLETAFYDSELPNLMKKAEVSSPKELEQKMRSYGTSLRNIKRSWKESQICGYYINEKMKEKKEPTPREIRDFYQEHLAEFEVPGRVRYEQLVVKVNRFKNRDEARNALASMGNQVIFGAPLEAVAKRSSQGPLAPLGGQHDWVTSGEITNESLRDILFKIPVNYLSDMIEDEDSIRIVRVLEREDGQIRPFSDVQKQIKEAIQMEYRQQKVTEFLESLKENIPVWTILDDEAKAAQATNTGGSINIR